MHGIVTDARHHNLTGDNATPSRHRDDDDVITSIPLTEGRD